MPGPASVRFAMPAVCGLADTSCPWIFSTASAPKGTLRLTSPRSTGIWRRNSARRGSKASWVPLGP
eukprot:9929296-Alexandrium_andersonii.AAC.1